MRRSVELAGKVGLLGLGCAGLMGWIDMGAVTAVVLSAVGLLLVGLEVLSLTFVEQDHPWPADEAEPQPLRLGTTDYAKALVAWLLAFRRTYAVAPGLYFTGKQYDTATPLLVTANYHLTVFLVARRLSGINVRLLVIDTDGINVWCAAGKGRFCNDTILQQLTRYRRELISGQRLAGLILPKFAMSGVDLQGLRDQGVRPIVGPLYARDLPAYLAAPPLRNRPLDRVRFSLRSRAFVCLPGVLQLAALSAVVTCLLGILALPLGMRAPVGVVVSITTLGAVYPLLFPVLPGRRFAVKGLMLGVAFSIAWMAMSWYTQQPLLWGVVVVPFTVAAGMLIGLEFTGNSAVSNYSRVKREIVTFLPVSALLLLVSLAAYAGIGRWL